MKIFRKIAIIAVLISLSSFSTSNIENRVAQIRKDYANTNVVKNYVVKEIEDLEESTDGGVIRHYSKNGAVRKITVEYYSENWKSFTEYYIKNRRIYFIFDRVENYNVPYYVNAKWYKENGMKIGEVFDLKKSKVFEKRYYFDENEKLIRYIDENKKIIENEKKLKEVEKNVLDEYFRIKNKN